MPCNLIPLRTRLRPSAPVPCALLIFFSAATASAEDIAILNAGFEDDPVAPGCFAVFTPNGWSVHDPTGIIGGNDVVGGLHPEGGPYFPQAPEGDHVGIVFIQDSISAGVMGLSQTLGDVLELNSTYTLTVQVGDIASGQGPPPCDIFGYFDLDGFPGYQVQLLAGGVVIAQDDNTLAPTLDDGQFALSTVYVEVADAHPLAGQPLEIRLINLNHIDTPAHPGIEVDFDDVRLVRNACTADADIDGNGNVEPEDLAIFVDVLIGEDINPAHVAACDLDCSGAPDGNDVGLMVEALLQ